MRVVRQRILSPEITQSWKKRFKVWVEMYKVLIVATMVVCCTLRRIHQLRNVSFVMHQDGSQRSKLIMGNQNYMWKCSTSQSYLGYNSFTPQETQLNTWVGIITIAVRMVFFVTLQMVKHENILIANAQILLRSPAVWDLVCVRIGLLHLHNLHGLIQFSLSLWHLTTFPWICAWQHHICS